MSSSRSFAHAGHIGPDGQSSVSSVSDALVQPGSLGKPGKPSPSASMVSLQAAGWQISAPAVPPHVDPGAQRRRPEVTSAGTQRLLAPTSPTTLSVYGPVAADQPSTEMA